MSLVDRKPFKEVQPGDKVYMLKPLTLIIQEATVVKSVVHPQSKNKSLWVLEVYKPTELKVTDEAMALAKDHMGAATTMQLWLEADAHMAALMLKPHPTMICTNKQILQEWLDKTDKATLLELSLLRGKL